MLPNASSATAVTPAARASVTRVATMMSAAGSGRPRAASAVSADWAKTVDRTQHERRRVEADPDEQRHHEPADDVGRRAGPHGACERDRDGDACKHRPRARCDAEGGCGNAQAERHEVERAGPGHGEGR